MFLYGFSYIMHRFTHIQEQLIRKTIQMSSASLLALGCKTRPLTKAASTAFSEMTQP